MCSRRPAARGADTPVATRSRPARPCRPAESSPPVATKVPSGLSTPSRGRESGPLPSTRLVSQERRHLSRAGVAGRCRGAPICSMRPSRMTRCGRRRQSFLLVVGDVDGGDAELFAHAPDLLAHRIGGARRRGWQGLVEQQARRAHHQGAGQGHPLLLAAGELGPAARVGPACRTERSAGPTRSAISGLGSTRSSRRPKATFSPTVEVGPEREALKDHAGVSGVGGNPVTSSRSKWIEPASGVRESRHARRSVVFPQPLGPRRRNISRALPEVTPATAELVAEADDESGW